MSAGAQHPSGDGDGRHGAGDQHERDHHAGGGARQDGEVRGESGSARCMRMSQNALVLPPQGFDCLHPHTNTDAFRAASTQSGVQTSSNTEDCRGIIQRRCRYEAKYDLVLFSRLNI